MPENKSKNKDPRPVDTDEAGVTLPVEEDTTKEVEDRREPFDLESVLAVGGPPVKLPIEWNDFRPVPIVFDGVEYVIGRRYSGKTVRKFFKLMRTTGDDIADQILDIVLTEGDPKQLWRDLGVLSMPESDKLFATIYKIAGLMSLSGKFLAS